MVTGPSSIWHYYWSICSATRQMEMHFCDGLWRAKIHGVSTSNPWKSCKHARETTFLSLPWLSQVSTICGGSDAIHFDNRQLMLVLKDPDITISVQHYCGTLQTHCNTIQRKHPKHCYCCHWNRQYFCATGLLGCPLSIPQMIWMNMEQWWTDTDRGNKGLRRKTVPVPLCLPQIPHGLTWAWTQPPWSEASN
jgi:hypothetical protein